MQAVVSLEDLVQYGFMCIVLAFSLRARLVLVTAVELVHGRVDSPVLRAAFEREVLASVQSNPSLRALIWNNDFQKIVLVE